MFILSDRIQIFLVKSCEQKYTDFEIQMMNETAWIYSFYIYYGCISVKTYLPACH